MSGLRQTDWRFLQETQILSWRRRSADYLNMPAGRGQGHHVQRRRDSDRDRGECARSKDVFVIQSTCAPVNDNLMELLLMIDAFKRSSARRITAVLPYYGYCAAGQKVAPRVPISAKLVADIITVAGANRVHYRWTCTRARSRGSSTSPWTTCSRRRCCSTTSGSSFDGNLVVVSPDAGGVERARAFAKRLDADLAIIDKRRGRAERSQGHGTSSAMSRARSPSSWTTWSTPPAPWWRRPKPWRARVRVKSTPAAPTRSSPGRRWIAFAVRRSKAWSSPTRSRWGPTRRRAARSACSRLRSLVGEAIVRSYRGDSVTSLFV